MANRIFYAGQQVGFAQIGSTNFTAAHGVQSVGMNTTFNLEEVFELGQISLYENIEGTPDIEVTLEKVLDGYPLLYHLATRGATAATLTGRATQKTIVALSVFDDAQDSASGTPLAQCVMSGLSVSSISYNFPVEGNFTEQITLVGNDKTWINSEPFTFSGVFDDTDRPVSIAGSGGVNRREDMLFDYTTHTLDVNGHVADEHATVLPGGLYGGIPGISSSGTNNAQPDGYYTAKIQNISVSTDLGREELFQLGKRTPYFRFVPFPVEVTCEIECTSTHGDGISATEEGVAGDGNNLTDKSIRIAVREGTRIDLGTKNKLQSVTHNGGDTGGGNVTNTYTYRNFNNLKVSHWADPTTAIASEQLTP